MQRATTAGHAATTPSPGSDASCPVCGEPVRGIASARPGEHRFVGCDHYASGRFLRSRDGAPVAAGAPLRLGP